MATSVHAYEMKRKVDLFSSLDDASLETLYNRMRLVEYALEAVICREGEPGDRMYIVDSRQANAESNCHAR